VKSLWAKAWERARPNANRSRSAASGISIAIGMFLASILDPKTRITTEMIDTKKNRDTTDPGKENA
jgi:hypothetical protein